MKYNICTFYEAPCSGNVCLYGGICHVDGDRPVCYCAHNYVGHVCGIKLGNDFYILVY